MIPEFNFEIGSALQIVPEGGAPVFLLIREVARYDGTVEVKCTDYDSMELLMSCSAWDDRKPTRALLFDAEQRQIQMKPLV